MSEKYTVVSVRLTNELKERIERLATEEHRSFSAQVLKDLLDLYEGK